MRQHNYYVYILASWSRVLYVGVTRGAPGAAPGAGDCRRSRRYRVGRLVYFEHTNDIQAAIAREKEIKGWNRARKLALVASLNPEWEELVHPVEPLR